MSRPLFALVESDPLQRFCSVDAISRIGFDCHHFPTVHDLVAALKQGSVFQAIGVGVHPHPTGALHGLRSACHEIAAAARVPLLFMAHHTEIVPLQVMLTEILREAACAGFICTPVVEEELQFRLDLLKTGRSG